MKPYLACLLVSIAATPVNSASMIALICNTQDGVRASTFTITVNPEEMTGRIRQPDELVSHQVTLDGFDETNEGETPSMVMQADDGLYVLADDGQFNALTFEGYHFEAKCHDVSEVMFELIAAEEVEAEIDELLSAAAAKAAQIETDARLKNTPTDNCLQQIEELEGQAERLIANSRMFQDQLAECRAGN